MDEGRILAIDYGSKNIGLACSDELGTIARPLPSIQPSSHRDLISKLRRLIGEHNVRMLVIGNPLNLDGSSGSAVRRVERFVSLLDKEFSLPLRRVDERLSTVEAMEIWKELNLKQQRRYRTIDSLAAALILERHLKESSSCDA
jgi:putative Holliday junction resolvase